MCVISTCVYMYVYGIYMYNHAKCSNNCDRQGRDTLIIVHVYMYEYRIYMCMEVFDDTAEYWTIIPFFVLHVVPLNK